MKAQLVVVRGKPEGKVIPLVGPSFKIGRGETCHLRPSSEQVSREHAEFTMAAGALSVRDLGSRNGTLVNGKALTAEAVVLKDRDLVQVGPLTFAVSIAEVPVAAAKPGVKPAEPAKVSLEEVSHEEIDSWLLGDSATAAAEQPTAVYGGDTITITAFKDASAAAKDASAAAKDASAAAKDASAAAKPPASDSDDEYVRQAEDELESGEPFEDDELVDEDDSEEAEASASEAMPEEFIDENNPFYAAKKAQQAAKSGPAKPAFKDTSDAATDILRRLMERRRASK
jgi:pSer/pThr/pTyr-binding forkhead associated (FHA) protein